MIYSYCGNPENLTDEQIEYLELLYQKNKLTPKYVLNRFFHEAKSSSVDFSSVKKPDVYAWLREKLCNDGNYRDYVDSKLIPYCRGFGFNICYTVDNVKRGWKTLNWKGTAKNLNDTLVIMLNELWEDDYDLIDFVEEILTGLHWDNAKDVGFNERWLTRDNAELKAIYKEVRP